MTGGIITVSESSDFLGKLCKMMRLLNVMEMLSFV